MPTRLGPLLAFPPSTPLRLPPRLLGPLKTCGESRDVVTTSFTVLSGEGGLIMNALGSLRPV